MQLILSSPLVERFFDTASMPPMAPVVQQLERLRNQGGDYYSIFIQDPGMMLQLLRMSANGTELDFQQLYAQAGQDCLDKIVDWAINTQPLSIDVTGPDYYLFWRTSMHRSALITQLMPLANLEDSLSTLTTLALVQEIALPMLLLCLDSAQWQAFPGFHVSLRSMMQWSQLSFGVDHRQLGHELFKRWGLPRLLLDSQKLILVEDAAPELRLLELTRRTVESFYAVEEELAQVQEKARKWFNIDDRQFDQAIVASLEILSHYSLNTRVHEELDDDW